MKKKLLSLLIAAAATTGLFAEDNNPMLWQDNGVPLRQGMNIEWQRTGLSTDDGVVYVWSDTKFGGRDVWAQKVGTDGELVWDAPKLVTDRPQRQEDPVAIETSDGNIIVAWVDFNEDADGDVFAQKIDANGDTVWSEPIVICQLEAEQKTLNIVPDNNGGVYILWVDKRGVGKDIYGQHVQSDGSVSWDANGLPLATGDGDQYSHTFWEDSATGEAVMIYVNKPTSGADIYALKVNPSGIVWGGSDNPVVLVDAVEDQDRAKICPDGTGGFYFSWIDRRVDNQGDIYAQRINGDGELQWDNPAIVSDASGIQRNPRVTKGFNGNLFVAWESILLGETNSDNVWIQKINSDGSIAWADNGIELVDQPNEQRNPRLTSDGNGGVVVTWDDKRGNLSNTQDIFAQHLNANGDIQWDADGKVICDAVELQHAPSIRNIDDNFYIAWGDRRNGSDGIYYQMINGDGELTVDTNGELIHWGLSGDVIKYCSGSYEDKVYYVWNDTRYGSLGWRILIQSIDADGNLGFPVNGTEITNAVASASNQENPEIVVTDDGVAIVWDQVEGDYRRVYAQLIDHNGNRMWGEDGLALSSHVNGQSLAQISYTDGDYYFSWIDLRNSSILNIFGQKVSADGTLQWGNDAVAIADAEADHELKKMVGSYVIWKQQRKLYVKKIDADGNNATGWTDEGLVLAVNTGAIAPDNPEAQLVGDDLFIVWEDPRHLSDENGGKSIYGQLIHADGTIAYQTHGLPFGHGDREQIEPDFVQKDGNVFVNWTDNREGTFVNIMMNKFEIATGNPVWDEAEYVGQQNSTQNNVVMGVSGDNIISVWEDTEESNIDLKVQRFDYVNGEFNWESGLGEDLVAEVFKQVDATVNTIDDDNNIISAWRDFRSSGKTDIIGLYAQKLDASTGVDDVAQNTFAKLHQNYPNPFMVGSSRNAGTTIAFELKEAQTANVSVYNVRGQKITTLYDNFSAAGKHYVTWNGKDNGNNDVSAGVYFYRVKTDRGTIAKKMLLLK